MAENEKAPEKAAEAKTAAKKASKPTDVKKIILIVAGVVIAFVILIVVIAMFATSGPKKVSDSFINNIQSKDATAGYVELSSEAQKTVTQEQFKAVVDQIGPILTGKPDSQGVETTTKDGKTTAKATYTIKGSDGNTYKITIDLIKQDDQWKIEIFNSEKQ